MSAMLHAHAWSGHPFRNKQISSILFYERKITTVKIDFDVPFKECTFLVIQSSRNNNTEKLFKTEHYGAPP